MKGVVFILFAVLLGSACADDAAAPVVSFADSLAVVSGSTQSGAVGVELADPLVVRALDAQGRPRSDVQIAFVVTEGGGSAWYTGIVRTDHDGLAINYWTLGTAAAGPQTLEARTIGAGGEQIAARFEATPVPGPAARIALLAGDNLTVTAGTPTPVAPAVQVTDRYGNAVAWAGVSVEFELKSGAGVVVGSPALSDANGVATLGQWILGPLPGLNEITATAAGPGMSPAPVAFTAWAAIGDTWLARPAMPTPRYALGAAAIGDKIYVAGGSQPGILGTLEAYDIVSKTWIARAPMLTPREGLGVGVVNGILYAVGGRAGSCNWCNTVEAYDPATDSWSTKAVMPTGRTLVAVAVVGGTLFAAGGTTQTANSRALEAYDPATNSWTAKADIPFASTDLVVTALNGRLYAVAFAFTGVYEPTTNTWQTLASPLTNRSGFGVGAAGDAVYAIGGMEMIPGNPTITPHVDRYDPATNSWRRVAALPTVRQYLAVVAGGGVLYAIGGTTDGTGTGETGVVEAYVP